MKRKKRLEKKITFDGKRYSVYGYSALEIAQKAEELERRLQAEKDPTFRKIAEEWQEDHEKEIGLYTADCYRAPLKDLIAEFGDEKIRDIAPLDLQRFIKAYADRGYKRQTVKLRLIVAHLVFEYAILQGFITANPSDSVTVPRSVHAGRRELPQEDDIAKIKKSSSEGFGLFPLLVMYTGLRRGEALALRFEDIDFKADSITVNKVVIFDEGGRPQIKTETKTAAGMRSVPLLAPLKRALKKRKEKTGFVFSPDGGATPLSKGQYDCALRKYKKDHGVTCGVHQLRHEFATFCFDAGLDPKDAQRILGHSKESVTRDIYTHIRDSRQQLAADKLNDFIKSNKAG